MYGKFTEAVVRFLYRKRFKQADTIANAATLAGQGKREEALSILKSLAREIHPSLRGIFGLTRGQILASQGLLKEAEQCLIAAAKAEPSNAKIHLELAIMSGRCFRFESARERLQKLAEEADPETKEKAATILSHLDSVVAGEQLAEFESRARAMSQRAIGPGGESPGLPADLDLLDDWITRCPEAALEHADDLALLVGHSETLGGASWKVGLYIADSVVCKDGLGELNPFRCLSKRLNSENTSLGELIQGGWASAS